MSHHNKVIDYFHPESESKDNNSDFVELNETISLSINTDRKYHGTGEIILTSDNNTESSNRNNAMQQPSFKQWEGRIVEIEDDNFFVARINEISGKGLSKIVRFDKRKVVFENIEQFQIGAPFYWKVGLFYKSNRMAVRRSEIRFKLLPPPNPILLKEAEEEIRRIFDMLSWMD